MDTTVVDALHIDVHPSFQALPGDSKELLECLSAIQGIYWLVGRDNRYGLPYFRQEPAPDGEPNGGELFLWFHPDKQHGGWYISSQIFDSQSPNFGVQVKAWLGSRPELPMSGATMGEDAPVHIPYWVSAKNKRLVHGDVIIQALHDYQFQCEVEQTQEIACLRDEIAKLTEAGSSTDRARFDEKPQVGPEQKNSGGWGPKVAELVVAVYMEKWQHVQTLATKYYNNSPTVKWLADQAMQQINSGVESRRSKSIAKSIMASDETEKGQYE